MPTQRCECGVKYRFPESAIGKRAKCKKCGTIFRIQPEDEPETIPLADEDPLGGLASAVDRSAVAPAKTVERPVSAASLPSAESEGRLGRVAIEDRPTRPSYAKSLLQGLMFPTASVGNAVTFGILWFLVFLAVVVLPWLWVYGLPGRLAIFGWYMGFRFNVIREAAGGERDLPGLSGGEGWIDDIIMPFLKWLASWIIVLLPASICFAVLVYMGITAGGNPFGAFSGGFGGMLQGTSGGEILFFVLTLAGWATWPMVVLCVALGGFAALGRPDAIVVTLVRTFPVYLLTAIIVIGADLLKTVFQGVMRPDGSGGLVAFMVLRGLSIGVEVYFEVVAMQAIGLYYFHFKRRFAWSWA